MINLNTFMDDPNLRSDQHFTGREAMLWTALPGIILSFDAAALTCEVQPAIQGKKRDEDGSITLVNLPILLDCPVVFPHAGGCSASCRDADARPIRRFCDPRPIQPAEGHYPG